MEFDRQKCLWASMTVVLNARLARRSLQRMQLRNVNGRVRHAQKR